MRILILFIFVLSSIFATAQNKVVLSVRGANKVDTIYRKAGQDSIFFTINGGAERAIKDSLGAGGGLLSDSLAIRRAGASLTHIVSFNANNSGGSNTAALSHNTFIGQNAGEDITDGFSNIAIGPEALRNITSGDENIAIGRRAMYLGVVTGDRNFAMGQAALENLTSGSNNVAIASFAARSITTGSGNVSIGASALDALTTGNDNVAIGGNALGALPTSGGRHVSIGTNSLLSANSTNSTGYNAALGYGAGGTVTSGLRNTAIGGLAMGVSSITTGSDNTYLGYNTGSGSSTTGSQNTFVGSGAGNAGALTTMQQATMIGANAGVNAGESFGTYLGYYAGGNANAADHTGSYNLALGYQAMYQNSATVRTGSSNTVIGDRINLPSVTSNDQFVWGTNGVNYLTRFTGGGWLVNNTTSAVTAQTAGAALEVKSTTGTFMPPVMTGVQATALGASPDGSIIYVTSTDGAFTSVGFWGMIAGTWTALHL